MQVLASETQAEECGGFLGKPVLLSQRPPPFLLLGTRMWCPSAEHPGFYSTVVTSVKQKADTLTMPGRGSKDAGMPQSKTNVSYRTMGSDFSKSWGRLQSSPEGLENGCLSSPRMYSLFLLLPFQQPRPPASCWLWQKQIIKPNINFKNRKRRKLK